MLSALSLFEMNAAASLHCKTENSDRINIKCNPIELIFH